MSLRKILLAIILVASFSSCKKILDANPEYNVDGANSFKTIEDCDFALVGAYTLFHSTSYYAATDGRSNAFALLPDILADNLRETGESLGNERVFSRWVYASDETQIERTWLAGYRIISEANLVLMHVDKFAATSQGAVNRIKGQALAIRALVHFDLLRYFVNDYARNSTSPGIPYVTKFDYEIKPSRGTVQETYNAIEADLLAARTLLLSPDHAINGSTGNTRAYLDRFAVDAILARMYLYAGQYSNAIQRATTVINAFPLADPSEFGDIWTDVSNTEVIWSVTFNAGEGGPGYHAYFPQPDANQYAPDPDLLNLYDAADVRGDAYFAVIGGRVVLSKYLAKAAAMTNPDGVVNFKAIRTGEMYLIRAEAYARTAADASGSADLNTLRSVRIIGYVPTALAGTALLNAIATERRKELVGEGHRFFDLKRTTRTVSRVGCSSFCTLGTTNRAWTWPIPQPEIDANPSILPQNPGY
ncbi:MAG: RagB/SusD family nutrient uptake outer membrane protein [Chitinophagales bacterium]